MTYEIVSRGKHCNNDGNRIEIILRVTRDALTFITFSHLSDGGIKFTLTPDTNTFKNRARARASSLSGGFFDTPT